MGTVWGVGKFNGKIERKDVPPECPALHPTGFP